MNIVKWFGAVLVPLLVVFFSFGQFRCTERWDPPCDIGDGCIGVAERITECVPNTAAQLAGVGFSVLWLAFFVFLSYRKSSS